MTSETGIKFNAPAEKLRRLFVLKVRL